MQQQRQIPPDAWQTRLAERIASKAWKDSDPVLASLTPEQAVEFLLAQQQGDRPLVKKYWRFQLLVKPTVSVVGYVLILLTMKHFHIPYIKGIFLIQLILGLFTESPFTPKKSLAAQRRQQRLNLLLAEYLPHCTSPELIPLLLEAYVHAPMSQRLLLERALTRTLTPLSGEAVFTLPFALRAQLAVIAEEPLTLQDLAIAICLALTSARDGNIQPVLRRMSRDARSVRLREVAAECLREFSDPIP